MLRRLAPDRPPTDAEVWACARSFDDLRRTMVDFLRGQVGATPGHWGPLDDESDGLVEHLVRFNLGGYLTDNSQPTDSGDGWEQVAYVTGFASPDLAQRIVALADHGSLGALATPPGAIGSRGRFGDLAPCVEGHPSPSWIADVWQQAIAPEAFHELQKHWYVIVFDTNDRDPGRLWRNVLEVIEGPPPGVFRLFDR